MASTLKPPESVNFGEAPETTITTEAPTADQILDNMGLLPKPEQVGQQLAGMSSEQIAQSQKGLLNSIVTDLNNGQSVPLDQLNAVRPVAEAQLDNRSLYAKFLDNFFNYSPEAQNLAAINNGIQEAVGAQARAELASNATQLGPDGGQYAGGSNTSGGLGAADHQSAADSGVNQSNTNNASSDGGTNDNPPASSQNNGNNTPPNNGESNNNNNGGPPPPNNNGGPNLSDNNSANSDSNQSNANNTSSNNNNNGESNPSANNSSSNNNNPPPSSTSNTDSGDPGSSLENPPAGTAPVPRDPTKYPEFPQASNSTLPNDNVSINPKNDLTPRAWKSPFDVSTNSNQGSQGAKGAADSNTPNTGSGSGSTDQSHEAANTRSASDSSAGSTPNRSVQNAGNTNPPPRTSPLSMDTGRSTPPPANSNSSIAQSPQPLNDSSPRGTTSAPPPSNESGPAASPPTSPSQPPSYTQQAIEAARPILQPPLRALESANLPFLSPAAGKLAEAFNPPLAQPQPVDANNQVNAVGQGSGQMAPTCAQKKERRIPDPNCGITTYRTPEGTLITCANSSDSPAALAGVVVCSTADVQKAVADALERIAAEESAPAPEDRINAERIYELLAETDEPRSAEEIAQEMSKPETPNSATTDQTNIADSDEEYIARIADALRALPDETSATEKKAELLSMAEEAEQNSRTLLYEANGAGSDTSTKAYEAAANAAAQTAEAIRRAAAAADESSETAALNEALQYERVSQDFRANAQKIESTVNKTAGEGVQGIAERFGPQSQPPPLPSQASAQSQATQIVRAAAATFLSSFVPGVSSSASVLVNMLPDAAQPESVQKAIQKVFGRIAGFIEELFVGDERVGESIAESAEDAGYRARINETRAAVGLAPLAYNGTLKAGAERGRADMHFGADEIPLHRYADANGVLSTPASRAAAAGYGVGKIRIGENLASGIDDFDTVFSAWLASPAHSPILLDPHVSEMAVAHDDGRWVLWTGQSNASGAAAQAPAVPVSTILRDSIPGLASIGSVDNAGAIAIAASAQESNMLSTSESAGGTVAPIPTAPPTDSAAAQAPASGAPSTASLSPGAAKELIGVFEKAGVNASVITALRSIERGEAGGVEQLRSAVQVLSDADFGKFLDALNSANPKTREDCLNLLSAAKRNSIITWLIPVAEAQQCSPSDVLAALREEMTGTRTAASLRRDSALQWVVDRFDDFAQQAETFQKKIDGVTPETRQSQQELLSASSLGASGALRAAGTLAALAQTYSQALADSTKKVEFIDNANKIAEQGMKAAGPLSTIQPFAPLADGASAQPSPAQTAASPPDTFPSASLAQTPEASGVLRTVRDSIAASFSGNGSIFSTLEDAIRSAQEPLAALQPYANADPSQQELSALLKDPAISELLSEQATAPIRIRSSHVLAAALALQLGISATDYALGNPFLPRFSREVVYHMITPFSYESEFTHLRTNGYSYGQALLGAAKKYQEGIINAIQGVPHALLGGSGPRIWKGDEQTERMMQNRLDAWRTYLQLPQLYGTFETSPYAMGLSDARHYMRMPGFWELYVGIDVIFNPDDKGSVAVKSLIRRMQARGENTWLEDDAYQGVMGSFTFSLGEDERGSFIAYYDKWNLEKTIEGEEGLVGKAFEIYDRYYYDPVTLERILPPEKSPAISDTSRSSAVSAPVEPQELFPRTTRALREAGSTLNSGITELFAAFIQDFASNVWNAGKRSFARAALEERPIAADLESNPAGASVEEILSLTPRAPSSGGAAASPDVIPQTERTAAQVAAMEALAEKEGAKLDSSSARSAYALNRWMGGNPDLEGTPADIFAAIADGSPAERDLVLAAAVGDPSGLVAEIQRRENAQTTLAETPTLSRVSGAITNGARRAARTAASIVLGAGILTADLPRVDFSSIGIGLPNISLLGSTPAQAVQLKGPEVAGAVQSLRDAAVTEDFETFGAIVCNGSICLLGQNEGKATRALEREQAPLILAPALKKSNWSTDAPLDLYDMHNHPVLSVQHVLDRPEAKDGKWEKGLRQSLSWPFSRPERLLTGPSYFEMQGEVINSYSDTFLKTNGFNGPHRIIAIVADSGGVWIAYGAGLNLTDLAKIPGKSAQIEAFLKAREAFESLIAAKVAQLAAAGQLAPFLDRYWLGWQEALSQSEVPTDPYTERIQPHLYIDQQASQADIEMSIKMQVVAARIIDLVSNVGGENFAKNKLQDSVGGVVSRADFTSSRELNEWVKKSTAYIQTTDELGKATDAMNLDHKKGYALYDEARLNLSLASQGIGDRSVEHAIQEFEWAGLLNNIRVTFIPGSEIPRIADHIQEHVESYVPDNVLITNVQTDAADRSLTEIILPQSNLADTLSISDAIPAPILTTILRAAADVPEWIPSVAKPFLAVPAYLTQTIRSTMSSFVNQVLSSPAQANLDQPSEQILADRAKLASIKNAFGGHKINGVGMDAIKAAITAAGGKVGTRTGGGGEEYATYPDLGSAIFADMYKTIAYMKLSRAEIIDLVGGQKKFDQALKDLGLTDIGESLDTAREMQVIWVQSDADHTITKEWRDAYDAALRKAGVDPDKKIDSQDFEQLFQLGAGRACAEYSICSGVGIFTDVDKQKALSMFVQTPEGKIGSALSPEQLRAVAAKPYDSLTGAELVAADKAVQKAFVASVSAKPGYAGKVQERPLLDGAHYVKKYPYEQDVAPVQHMVSHVGEGDSFEGVVSEGEGLSKRGGVTAYFNANIYVENCAVYPCRVLVRSFEQRTNSVAAVEGRKSGAPSAYNWNSIAAEISAPSEAAVTDAAARTLADVYKAYGDALGPGQAYDMVAHDDTNEKSPGEGQKAKAVALQPQYKPTATQAGWQVAMLKDAGSTPTPAVAKVGPIPAPITQDVAMDNSPRAGTRTGLAIPKGLRLDQPIQIVVFLEGFRSNSVIAQDKANLPQQLQGTNAVLVVPDLGTQSDPGNFADAGAFKKFVDEAKAKLASLVGVSAGAANPFASADIVLVSYSGGYRAAAGILQGGGTPVKGVVLLDSLYGNSETFADWIRKNPNGFFVSSTIPNTETDPRSTALQASLTGLTDANGNSRVKSALGNTITSGDAIFLHSPGGSAELAHSHYVGNAWTANPVADILHRIGSAPAVEVAEASPPTTPVGRGIQQVLSSADVFLRRVMPNDLGITEVALPPQEGTAPAIPEQLKTITAIPENVRNTVATFQPIPYGVRLFDVNGQALGDVLVLTKGAPATETEAKALASKVQNMAIPAIIRLPFVVVNPNDHSQLITVWPQATLTLHQQLLAQGLPGITPVYTRHYAFDREPNKDGTLKINKNNIGNWEKILEAAHPLEENVNMWIFNDESRIPNLMKVLKDAEPGDSFGDPLNPNQNNINKRTLQLLVLSATLRGETDIGYVLASTEYGHSDRHISGSAVDFGSGPSALANDYWWRDKNSAKLAGGNALAAQFASVYEAQELLGKTGGLSMGVYSSASGHFDATGSSFWDQGSQFINKEFFDPLSVLLGNKAKPTNNLKIIHDYYDGNKKLTFETFTKFREMSVFARGADGQANYIFKAPDHTTSPLFTLKSMEKSAVQVADTESARFALFIDTLEQASYSTAAYRNQQGPFTGNPGRPTYMASGGFEAPPPLQTERVAFAPEGAFEPEQPSFVTRVVEQMGEDITRRANNGLADLLYFIVGPGNPSAPVPPSARVAQVMNPQANAAASKSAPLAVRFKFGVSTPASVKVLPSTIIVAPAPKEAARPTSPLSFGVPLRAASVEIPAPEAPKSAVSPISEPTLLRGIQKTAAELPDAQAGTSPKPIPPETRSNLGAPPSPIDSTAEVPLPTRKPAMVPLPTQKPAAVPSTQKPAEVASAQPEKIAVTVPVSLEAQKALSDLRAAGSNLEKASNNLKGIFANEVFTGKTNSATLKKILNAAGEFKKARDQVKTTYEQALKQGALTTVDAQAVAKAIRPASEAVDTVLSYRDKLMALEYAPVSMIQGPATTIINKGTVAVRNLNKTLQEIKGVKKALEITKQVMKPLARTQARKPAPAVQPAVQEKRSDAGTANSKILLSIFLPVPLGGGTSDSEAARTARKENEEGESVAESPLSVAPTGKNGWLSKLLANAERDEQPIGETAIVNETSQITAAQAHQIDYYRQLAAALEDGDTSPLNISTYTLQLPRVYVGEKTSEKTPSGLAIPQEPVEKGPSMDQSLMYRTSEDEMLSDTHTLPLTPSGIAIPGEKDFVEHLTEALSQPLEREARKAELRALLDEALVKADAEARYKAALEANMNVFAGFIPSIQETAWNDALKDARADIEAANDDFESAAQNIARALVALEKRTPVGDLEATGFEQSAKDLAVVGTLRGDTGRANVKRVSDEMQSSAASAAANTNAPAPQQSLGEILTAWQEEHRTTPPPLSVSDQTRGSDATQEGSDTTQKKSWWRRLLVWGGVGAGIGTAYDATLNFFTSKVLSGPLSSNPPSNTPGGSLTFPTDSKPSVVTTRPPSNQPPNDPNNPNGPSGPGGPPNDPNNPNGPPPNDPNDPNNPPNPPTPPRGPSDGGPWDGIGNGSGGSGFLGGGMSLLNGLLQGLAAWWNGQSQEEAGVGANVTPSQSAPFTPMQPAQKPVGAIVGNPSLINRGATTTLSWSSVGTDVGSSTCAVITADFAVIGRGGQNGSMSSPRLTESTRFGLVCNVYNATDKLLNETLVRVRGDDTDPPPIFSDEVASGSPLGTVADSNASQQSGQGQSGASAPISQQLGITPEDIRTCDPDQSMDSFIRCLCEAEPNPNGCTIPPGGLRL